MASTFSTLPPDLFDQTTLVSLFSTLAILAVAWLASRGFMPTTTPTHLRALFVWHAFDALIHFCLEGSFLYHCFVSSKRLGDLTLDQLRDGAYYLSHQSYLTFLPGADGAERLWGAQAGGDSPMAQLWMVYARADKRWAGADLGVVSLELLTVFIGGPLACWVCYDLARRNPRANITMVVLATAELYGGFMTFCPEWLTGNPNLDTSNFMYLWVYLVFFNMLWVFIPLYALWVAAGEISDAFASKQREVAGKKDE